MRLPLTYAVLLALLAAWLPGAVSPAAEEDARPAEESREELPPELKRVLEHLRQAGEEVRGVRAKVHYRREIPLLDESESSEGRLEFKKPDLLHLKLGKPRNEETYSDGRHWYVISHEDRQVEIYRAAEGSGASAEASFLTFGYGEGPEKLLESYRVELISKARPEPEKDEDAPMVYRLRFEPRDEEAPARFSAIGVEMTDRRWLPRTIVLHESEGEIVHTFQLEEIKLNPGLKEKRFSYEPPRGYAVLRPGQ